MLFGDRVLFRVTDVFLPAAEELTTLMTLTGEVEGAVTGFSDSGAQSRVYAVLEVVQRCEVVVPVDKLRRVGTGVVE